ncbi:unnamed protein product [Closterium sp. NIES-65]|nr:unnamed protein product [Closterium sp. NIES-65]
MPPGAPPPNPTSGNATAGVAADTTSLSASAVEDTVPPGPSAEGETIPATGSQPAVQAHDSATHFSSAGEGTGGISAASPSAGPSISGPPPVGAGGDDELSAADVHYFAETLRQWHGQTDTPRCPSAGAFRRRSVGGKPRGIPLQMSAPVGGSAAMRGAAAKEKKQKKEEEEEQPLLAQGGAGAAPRGRAAGADAGAMAADGAEGAGEFDYGKLRGVLTGLAKDVLVELWIEQHVRLVEVGEREAAAEAYRGIMERAQQLQRVSFRVPSKREGLTGIDLLLRDGLLAFLVKLSQYLPPMPEQVVKLHDVTYTAKIQRKQEGYETVGSKLLGCFLPCASPPAPWEDFNVLSDLSAYFMPGSLTLICGPPGCDLSAYFMPGSLTLICGPPGCGETVLLLSPHFPLQETSLWEDFDVLSNLSAFFMPGSLTLICDPPGCGKSAFHKTIAGRLPETKSLRLSGEVTYNGRPWREVQVRRMTALVGQTDEHIPTLTVMETCKFAQECNRLITPKDYEPLQGLIDMVRAVLRGGEGCCGLGGMDLNFEFTLHIRTELGGMDLKLEFTLHLLGLKGAANTIVGSRTVRGVSGGERHRVTTAEMMSGMFVVMAFDEISTGLDSSATCLYTAPLLPPPTHSLRAGMFVVMAFDEISTGLDSSMFVVMAFDEISTGLDSSATYDIVSAIRTIARVRRTTNAFSLLQPPPEVFNLFDRVIVLSEGSIIYQGPRADVLAYFEGLGYRKPPHVDVADFIQEIPTESGVEFVAPGAAHLSTAQLVEAYQNSAHYRDVMRVVQGEKVCKSVWVEVQPPIDLTFSVSGDSVPPPSSTSPSAVVVASVAPHSHLARPDITCTDTVHPGDSVTGLALPGGIMQYAKAGDGRGGGGREGGEQEGVVSAEELQKKLLVAAKGGEGGGKEGEGEGEGGGAVRLQLERPLVQFEQECTPFRGGPTLSTPPFPPSPSPSLTIPSSPDSSSLTSSPHLQEEEPSHAKFEQEYAIPWWPSTKLVVGRQFKVAIRNTSFLIARGMQVLILGIFTGTVFFQIPNTVSTATMQLRLSIAFAATMALALGGFALIPNIIDERQVVEKQLGARFYRSTSYVIASTICNFPFSLAEVLIYGPLVYWLTGMSAAQGASHFFLFMLLLLAVDVMGATLIRLIASVSSSREMASSLAGLMVITFLLFTGFLLTKPNIPPWWIWMYYINPLQYGVTAICINEFLSGSYNELCSTVNTTTASFCINKPAGTTAGEAFLQFFGMPSSFGAVWISFAALIAFTALFISLTFLAASRVRFNENKTPPASRLPPLPPQRNVFQKAVRAVKKQMSAEGEAGKGGEEEGRGEGEAEEAQAMIKRDGAGAAGAAAGGAGAAEGSLIEDGAEDGGSKAAPQSRVQFTPTTLSFHDLLYEVDVPGMSEPKVLLNSISGFVRPGTMTALMGSSGAGKTTLLDVLAGRKTIGRIRGDILVNSFPKVQDTFARISGYVEQSDIHTPFITIRESLQFSAALRLPSTTSRAERALVVQEAMDLLELHDIADTLVGFIGVNGLSVEQAKRLTIGVELVANPSVLFLDEPTSGLDSRAADIVVRGIRNIAATGRSTICTIHQPSRRLFFAFDWLYLMKRGGEVVYFGPIGHNGCDLLSYFESLPGLPKCRDDQNPATYMLEMIGAGIGHAAMRDFALDYAESILAADNRATRCDPVWQGRVRPEAHNLPALFLPSPRPLVSVTPLHPGSHQTEEQLDAIRFGRGEYGPEPTVKGYAATFGTMTRVVFLRQFRTYWRNVSYSFGRIMFSIILGLILGSAFWQVGGERSWGSAFWQVGGGRWGEKGGWDIGVGAAMCDQLHHHARLCMSTFETSRKSSTSPGRSTTPPRPALHLARISSMWLSCFNFSPSLPALPTSPTLAYHPRQINYTTTPGFASRQGLIYVALVFVAVINANNVIPQVNAERPVYYREKASNMYSPNVEEESPLFQRTPLPPRSPPSHCPPSSQVNAERPVYYREKASNMYSAFLYNVSWGLIEMPYLALTTLIFCSICFGMAGVATGSAEDFFLYWLNFFLYSACITYYGIFMAMLTPNAEGCAHVMGAAALMCE